MSYKHSALGRLLRSPVIGADGHAINASSGTLNGSEGIHKSTNFSKWVCVTAKNGSVPFGLKGRPQNHIPLSSLRFPFKASEEGKQLYQGLPQRNPQVWVATLLNMRKGPMFPVFERISKKFPFANRGSFPQKDASWIVRIPSRYPSSWEAPGGPP